MKSIHIYKTKKDYKIITFYKLESGSYIGSDPVFVMPIDVSSEDLAGKLFEALNASRTLKESEEDKFWLGNGLLKKIKETSFNKFYATSLSCNVSFDKGIIILTPYKYTGKDQGLEMEESRTYRVALEKNNRLEVVEKIKQMLASVDS